MSYRIDTDLAIIGNGDAIKSASIVVEGDKLSYVGEQEHAPDVAEILQAPVVTPGFWDAHTHYFGLTKFDWDEQFLDDKVKYMRCGWDTKETLLAGITSVREVGGFGLALKQSIAEGSIIGPRIYAAGRMISMTGGHGDAHTLHPDMVAHRFMTSNTHSPIANGVDECRQAVRNYLREGAEVIKFAASGGVMSEIDHPMHQQYSMEEQLAIIEEAARADAATAAHCYGSVGIRTALEAGVKTIEHGTYLDEDLCDLMIEKDAILVPTAYVYKGLFGTDEAKENTPEYGYRKGQLILKTHMQMLEMAIKKGVKLAMGTDIIVTGDYHPIYKYGDNMRELQYFVEAGMQPMDAIIAATSTGPQTLGKRAPNSGLLKTGYDADLVLLNDNPLNDIKILNDRSKIDLVVRGGMKYGS